LITSLRIHSIANRFGSKSVTIYSSIWWFSRTAAHQSLNTTLNKQTKNYRDNRDWSTQDSHWAYWQGWYQLAEDGGLLFKHTTQTNTRTNIYTHNRSIVMYLLRCKTYPSPTTTHLMACILRGRPETEHYLPGNRGARCLVIV